MLRNCRGAPAPTAAAVHQSPPLDVVVNKSPRRASEGLGRFGRDVILTLAILLVLAQPPNLYQREIEDAVREVEPVFPVPPTLVKAVIRALEPRPERARGDQAAGTAAQVLPRRCGEHARGLQLRAQAALRPHSSEWRDAGLCGLRAADVA